nr:transposase [Magnetofaba australis]
MCESNGYILAPFSVAPVNQHDTTLLKDSLEWLALICQTLGLSLIGSVLNLDPGFDSKANRRAIFNRRMKPNIKPVKRARKNPKRGRKRHFDEATYALRQRVERTFAWEDKFKRLLIRFEHIQWRHLGFKLMAYTLINIRDFCQH